MKRMIRIAGAPLRLPLLAVVGLWRRLIGPMTGPRCRFHPSCSAYAEEAIRVHGAVKGLGLSLWRVLRCSPLSSGGMDPVPGPGAWRSGEYDTITQSVARRGGA